MYRESNHKDILSFLHSAPTIKPMNDDLKDRLRRLGVVKGMRNLKPAPPVGRPIAAPDPVPDMQDQPAITSDQAETVLIESLFPGGYLEETSVGECFVLDKVYPLAYYHGPDQLSDLLQMSTTAAAVFCQDERLREFDFRDFLFLDTETTGLFGAGTLAFMVGVAFVDSGAAGEVLVVRQYFLRDHGDEPAMLFLLNG
jgi:hypothetical protein